MFTAMRFVALITACFTVAVLALDASLDDVHKAFYDNDIFGDVIPATNFSCILGLQYTHDGETNVDTFSGIHLMKATVENQPSLHLKVIGQEVDPNRKLALLAIDPDAPTPKKAKWANVLHWMQGDLHMANGEGEEDSLLLLPQSPPVFPYLGPAPPRKSTAHRYVFLLYDSTPEFESLRSDSGKLSHRKHFDIAHFMRRVKFEEPIAGTFFWVSQNPAEIPTMTTEAPLPTTTGDDPSEEPAEPVPEKPKEPKEPKEPIEPTPLVVQRGGINLLQLH